MQTITTERLSCATGLDLILSQPPSRLLDVPRVSAAMVVSLVSPGDQLVIVMLEISPQDNESRLFLPVVFFEICPGEMSMSTFR